MADHGEIDSVTGRSTTGHEWDGIKELNTPLPRWWVITFYICIIWSIGYWIVYPAWPLITTNTKGWLGYSSRADVAEEVANLEKARGVKMAALATAPLAEIEKDPALQNLALAKGKAVFGDNCAPCHGTGAAGSKGFPNLNDDDWLWGGTLDDIMKTIQHGVRSGDPDGHDPDASAHMPAWGSKDAPTQLKPDEIVAVANYVLSLEKPPAQHDAAAAAKGKQIFADNCVACHGEDAKGNQEMGAPNLTDGISLYGNDLASLIDTITHGRSGVMPAWQGRLDPATIKALAVYIHTRGGGK